MKYLKFKITLRRYLLVITLLLSNANLLSQNEVIDSLDDYNNLRNLYYNFYNLEDYESAKKYADLYFSKAKRDKILDKRDIIGYHYIARLVDEGSYVKYMDSAINVGLRLDDQSNYPAGSYLNLGEFYYDQRDYQNALSNFIKGLEFANENSDNLRIPMFNIFIGLIKMERINKEKEAIALFKESEKYYDTIANNNPEYYNKLTVYFAMASAYSRLENIDSSEYYINKGIELSRINKDSVYLEYFKYLNGINSYKLGNILKSLNILKGSYEYIEEDQDYGNLIEINYYLGIINKELNNNEASIVHFKRMDSLYNIYSMYSKQIRNGYEEIIRYYKGQNDNLNELKYVMKLLEVDSLYISDYERIVNTMYTEYDNKRLIDSKREISNQLKETRVTSKKHVVILSAILLLTAILAIFYYFKRKEFERKYQFVLNIENNDNFAKLPRKSSLDIDAKIIEEILLNLNSFEKKFGFLDTRLNLSNLSKILNYNSKYVSSVINEYKGASVVNYINDLRINYCVMKLKSDARFRNYKIKNIAEEVGFNNSRSFNNAFIKRYDISAYSFIKKIKK